MNKKREEVFKKVLYLYGFGVLILLRKYVRYIEAYEDLRIIRNLLFAHDITDSDTIEDWVCEFWRMGMSGDTALSNLYGYFNESVKILYDNTGNG